jgi:hypothetical protein
MHVSIYVPLLVQACAQLARAHSAAVPDTASDTAAATAEAVKSS